MRDSRRKKDAILKRWTSYGAKKRDSVIKEACPEMSSSNLITHLLRHGDSFDYHCFEQKDAYRMDFIFFPITTELLANDPLSLIALADRRSSLKPEKFAAHYLELLTLGFRECAFSPTHVLGCIFMYGKPFGYFDKQFQVDELHCKNMYPTHLGLLVLERQVEILKMLCNVLERLTSNLADSSPSDKWDALAAQKSKVITERTDGIMGSLSLRYPIFN